METGFLIVNLLGCVLVITSTLVVLARKLRSAAYMYALQSLVIVAMFATLGATTGSTELYMWSVSAFVTKVVLVPGIMLYTIKKMGDDADVELPSKLSPVGCVLLVIAEVVVCYLAVMGISLPTAAAVHPALAISLAHFAIGLTCIVSQRNIMKQVFGYCLMENGSHVTLALLAPNAPGLVETGIATDAVFAVIIMVFIACKIHRVNKTLDAHDLMNLRG
ncbi:hydrogenase 4 membrane subunit [Denitrobacterium detoxificans]|jgi:hydrogenase-4 component E|uniref:hydrogenase 4 membrane subunit n=1 Tax=Denitrobacterium detoxificans TaxID=79604 RepID=UPI0026F00E68|nr:hydrogenase 4 membrane subunit [Denitrobacterium detoxificans]MBE6466869.1 hydrogenase 4 membrane subunit [Denitrobacterium detoxificans]